MVAVITARQPTQWSGLDAAAVQHVTTDAAISDHRKTCDACRRAHRQARDRQRQQLIIGGGGGHWWWWSLVVVEVIRARHPSQWCGREAAAVEHVATDVDAAYAEKEKNLSGASA